MNSWTLWLAAQPSPAGSCGVHPSSPSIPTPQGCLLTHTRLPPTHAHTSGSTTGVPHKVHRRSVLQQGSASQSKEFPEARFPRQGFRIQEICHSVPTNELPHKVLRHTIALQNLPQTDFSPKRALPLEVTDSVEPWFPRIDPTEINPPRVCPNTPHKIPQEVLSHPHLRRVLPPQKIANVNSTLGPSLSSPQKNSQTDSQHKGSPHDAPTTFHRTNSPQRTRGPGCVTK